MSKVIKEKSNYEEVDMMGGPVRAKGYTEEHTQEWTDWSDKMNSNDKSIKYIEKHYPETAKEFQRLQFEQWALFCKKQMDYGPSNISMGTSLVNDDEKRLSLVGLIVRINDKVQRLLNLVVKHNREAQNEPAMDAFKDLSVYGIIAQIVKNGKWGK